MEGMLRMILRKKSLVRVDLDDIYDHSTIRGNLVSEVQKRIIGVMPNAKKD